MPNHGKTICNGLAILSLVFSGVAAHAFEPGGQMPKRLIMDSEKDMIVNVVDCDYTPPFSDDFFDFSTLQSNSGGSDSDDCNDHSVGATGVATQVTDGYVRALSDADRTCNDIMLARPQDGIDVDLFRIDCYRVMYRKLAQSMPTTGDYVPIRAALLEASDKLGQIVRENQDTSIPPMKVRERAKPAAPATEGLRAIRADRLEVAEAQAEAVLEETAIVILRAGEIPTRRNIHYARVSAAIEENLAVLRSA
jgi:hypothetical protein